jgi:Xaa-Pro aminopeptidase
MSSDAQPKLPNRQTPFSNAFREFIPQSWAPYPAQLPDAFPAAAPAAERRARIAAAYPGERLIIPAGGLKVRANDTDFRFRPHSALFSFVVQFCLFCGKGQPKRISKYSRFWLWCLV